MMTSHARGQTASTTILVIDDEPQIRRLIRNALVEAGYGVSEAGTAESGVDHAAAEQPALILLDLGLPDREGERPIAPSIGVRIPPESISGTMAFLADRRGGLSHDALSDATHVGVYDIDLGAFGIRLHDSREVPVLLARTKGGAVVAEAHAPDLAARESVTIVLDPTASRYPFQLNGVFTADRITGSWTAGQSLGGGGRFVLRPHRTLP